MPNPRLSTGGTAGALSRVLNHGMSAPLVAGCSNDITIAQFAVASNPNNDSVSVVFANTPTVGNLMVFGMLLWADAPSVPTPPGLNFIGTPDGQNFYWYDRVVQAGDGTSWAFSFTDVNSPANGYAGIAIGAWELTGTNTSTPTIGYAGGDSNVGYSVSVGEVDSGSCALPLIMASNANYYSSPPPGPMTFSANTGSATKQAEEAFPYDPPYVDNPQGRAFGYGSILPLTNERLFTESLAYYTSENLPQIAVLFIQPA